MRHTSNRQYLQSYNLKVEYLGYGVTHIYSCLSLILTFVIFSLIAVNYDYNREWKTTAEMYIYIYT
jgi:hypothetical protein